jgi:hypothetical protein
MKKIFMAVLFTLISSSWSFARIVNTDDISIDIPDSWTLISASEPDILLAEFTGAGAPIHLIITKEKAVFAGDAERQKEINMENIQGIFGGIKVMESKDNYWVFEENLSDAQQPLIQIQYFFVKDDLIYILKFSCTANLFKSMRSTFENIEKTFRLRG